jgi:hypothetical protein
VLLRLAALAAAAVAAAGCGDSTEEASPTTTAAAADASFPAGCKIPDVDTIVTAFLARPELAPAGFFQTYASYETDGRTFVTRNRAAALKHLQARRSLGERRRLLSLRVEPQDFNHVRIRYSLTRFAPDFRARGIHTRVAEGAGTIDCAHGKVAAWVMKGP